MVYSKAGVALTESFEACRLTAYQDVKGVWTIGVGHTGPEVKEGLVWTQQFADTMLIADVSTAVYCVNVSVTIPLSQGEFDAIVDFAFNCGCAAFKGPTMLKDINAGNLAGAADEFARWDHASGQVVAGLLRRRIAEEQEFKS